ncbi:hypothetical protein PCASD_16712 [Puccinia coronata f. sp. avenae]|uniref:Uncharacterized protein n=1 Tax=Puccinia coronata f. sp. avenae TaxID=200324 RepID=A0A2N5SW86_9BASI|nr:hypothetical protein PCASD_16712 [Puccinia coronata f. sp. avenae]
MFKQLRLTKNPIYIVKMLESLKLSKLPGNPRTQLHSTYALAYFDHPPVPSRQPASQRQGQRRAGDKRRFSTPTRTRTTWGQDSTVPPWAVLGSKGEIR